jgi:hypothetical protein
VCDGEGGFDIDLGEYSFSPAFIKECVIEHEESHIEDYVDFYPTACYESGDPNCDEKDPGGDPDQGIPILESKAWDDYTECNADIVERDCWLGELNGNISDEEIAAIMVEWGKMAKDMLDRGCT